MTDPKIGLVGYSCKTGLGEKNRQLEHFLDIHRWLIKPHSNQPNIFPPERCHCEVSVGYSQKDINNFLAQVDVVLFDETPYYPRLIQDAKRAGKRIVCIMAMEWFPFRHAKEVDLFICPTQQGYDLFKDQYPCALFPWPVDTDRFQFQERTTVEKFLFLNGTGGWNGRKGASVILKALELWPEMPLVVRSQVALELPDSVEVLPPCTDNSELYSVGDVLLNPSSIDGTGLQPMEAMACGMPVISTDGLPWNEIPSIGKIDSITERRKITHFVDWYIPSPQSLVDLCKTWINQNIEPESNYTRVWALGRSFNRFTEELDLLIKGS